MNGQIGHSCLGKPLGEWRPVPRSARPRALPHSDIRAHVHVRNIVGIHHDCVRGDVDVRRRKTGIYPGSAVKEKNVFSPTTSEGDVQGPCARVFDREGGVKTNAGCCVWNGWEGLFRPCSAGEFEMPNLS